MSANDKLIRITLRGMEAVIEPDGHEYDVFVEGEWVTTHYELPAALVDAVETLQERTKGEAKQGI